MLASKFVVSDDVMKIFGEGKYVDAKGRRRKIMGVGTFPDEIPLQSLNMEGSLSFGKISCDEIQMSGECFGESLTANNFSVAGVLRVNSVNVTHNLKVDGSLKVDNLIAKEIFIRSRLGSVDTVKCQRIKIFDDSFTDVKDSRVCIKSLEADTVELTNSAVAVIRCRDAFIGENCSVEKLFVTGKCTVAPTSTVSEMIRT